MKNIAIVFSLLATYASFSSSSQANTYQPWDCFLSDQSTAAKKQVVCLSGTPGARLPYGVKRIHWAELNAKGDIIQGTAYSYSLVEDEGVRGPGASFYRAEPISAQNQIQYQGAPLVSLELRIDPVFTPDMVPYAVKMIFQNNRGDLLDVMQEMNAAAEAQDSAKLGRSFGAQ